MLPAPDTYAANKHTTRQRSRHRHQQESSCRRLGRGGGLLLLSVRAPLGAVRHDAAVVGGLWAQRARRRLHRRAFLLRVFAVQSGRRRGHGSVWDRGRFFRLPRLWLASAPLLFATGNSEAASVGRLLQGAGGVFAPVGAIYIAIKYFPASQAATLIGATQMFGMAGGSAGQFAVGPMIGAGLPMEPLLDWHGHLAVLLMAGLLLLLLPREEKTKETGGWLKSVTGAFVRRFQESAIDLVRLDRRAAFHSDDDLRHDLGRALSPGGARF